MRVRDYNPHVGHKDEVIREYMGLARSIARRFRWAVSPQLGMEDLEAEAYLSLVKAFDRYSGGDATFKTYAFSKIQWALRYYIRARRPTAHVPEEVITLAGRIRREGLSAEAAERIADVIGCSIRMAERAQLCLQSGAAGGGISLDMPLDHEDGTPQTLLDLLKVSTDESELVVSEFLRQLPACEKAFVQTRMAGERIDRPALLKSVQNKLAPFLELREEDIAQMSTELTKDKYLERKAQGIPDVSLRKEFHIGEATLTRLKKKWGVTVKGGRSKTITVGGSPAQSKVVEERAKLEPNVKQSALDDAHRRIVSLEQEVQILKATLKFYL